MHDGSEVQTTYSFTASELARLSAYRAAVQAGLYSDQNVETDGDWDDLLAQPADEETPEASDVFTPEQIERLGSFRDAIEGGLLSD